MLEWRDVYAVVNAMVPMYVAIGLGYGSVKWWRIFTPDQCVAVNRFVSYITLPLFTYEFVSQVNPFKINFRFIAADAISKVVIVVVLIIWARCRGEKVTNYDWCITNFSLATLPSTLLVGVPLLKSTYGAMAQDLVVQSTVLQGIIWLTLLLFAMEVRRTRSDHAVSSSTPTTHEAALDQLKIVIMTSNETGKESALNGADQNITIGIENQSVRPISRPSLRSLMKVVILKFAYNPNSYSSIVALIWAAISQGFHIEMPEIIQDSVLILSKAGAGTCFFSLGLFMALQEKVISCGWKLAFWGLLLRFIVGPLAMVIGNLTVGLHGNVFRVAVIQSALPQGVACFIYARDYDLHPQILGTALTFGTLVSLPILIGYYALMESLHFL